VREKKTDSEIEASRLIFSLNGELFSSPIAKLIGRAKLFSKNCQIK